MPGPIPFCSVGFQCVLISHQGAALMKHRKVLLGVVGVFFLSVSYANSEDPVDLSVIHRIKAEAFENSKVMEHVFYLTDVHGPRLTGSPGYKEAGDWVVSRLTEYGLTNVREEPWGPFG